MLRILQIGLSSNPGGIENCILNYNRHIDRSRFCFDYADIYGNGLTYDEEIRSLGGAIYTLPNFKRNPLLNSIQLRDIIYSQQYNIVHINVLSAANIISPFIACNSQAIVIIHCHSTSTPSGFLRRLMNYVNLKWFRQSRVVKWSCCLRAGRWMWGDAFSMSDIIPNAVDVNLFKKNVGYRRTIRTQCGFANDDVVIGFVGGLCEPKNVLFIPEILAALRKRSRKFKALLIGDGVMRKGLIEKIHAFHITDDVYIAGIQQRIYEWYQAMDVFILPSLFEGLPVVGVEAQAAGLPCFMSDTITEEVNISGTVTYLPIHKGGDVWADAIDHVLSKKQSTQINIPRNYQIQYAAKELEHRYESLTRVRGK